MLNDRLVRAVEGGDHGLLHCTFVVFTGKHEKTHENLSHDGWNSTDILIEHLPNTGLEFDLYTKVLSSVPD
jgi:hypothetical protein